MKGIVYAALIITLVVVVCASLVANHLCDQLWDGATLAVTAEAASRVLPSSSLSFNTSDWDPYVPDASRVEFDHWEKNGTVYMTASITFATPAYVFLSVVPPSIVGNNISVDSEIWRIPGMVPQVITTRSQTYCLGRLLAGEYFFDFKAWGSSVKSVAFTVEAKPTDFRIPVILALLIVAPPLLGVVIYRRKHSARGLTLVIPLIVAIVFAGVLVNLLQTRAVTVEATNYPLKMTMTLDKPGFKLGEPVEIFLELRILGNETLTLSFCDGHDAYDFTVYDANNTKVYRVSDHAIYTMPYHPIQVEAGARLCRNLTWYQEATPGTYHITSSFNSLSLNVTVETPPVRITILNQTINAD